MYIEWVHLPHLELKPTDKTPFLSVDKVNVQYGSNCIASICNW